MPSPAIVMRGLKPRRGSANDAGATTLKTCSTRFPNPPAEANARRKMTPVNWIPDPTPTYCKRRRAQKRKTALAPANSPTALAEKVREICPEGGGEWRHEADEAGVALYRDVCVTVSPNGKPLPATFSKIINFLAALAHAGYASGDDYVYAVKKYAETNDSWNLSPGQWAVAHRAIKRLGRKGAWDHKQAPPISLQDSNTLWAGTATDCAAIMCFFFGLREGEKDKVALTHGPKESGFIEELGGIQRARPGGAAREISTIDFEGIILKSNHTRRICVMCCCEGLEAVGATTAICPCRVFNTMKNNGWTLSSASWETILEEDSENSRGGGTKTHPPRVGCLLHLLGMDATWAAITLHLGWAPIPMAVYYGRPKAFAFNKPSRAPFLPTTATLFPTDKDDVLRLLLENLSILPKENQQPPQQGFYQWHAATNKALAKGQLEKLPEINQGDAEELWSDNEKACGDLEDEWDGAIWNPDQEGPIQEGGDTPP